MSLRSAINMKCKECIYDATGRGSWREQVAACTSFSCSLWGVRPYPIKLDVFRLEIVLDEQGVTQTTREAITSDLESKTGQIGLFSNHSELEVGVHG